MNTTSIVSLETSTLGDEPENSAANQEQTILNIVNGLIGSLGIAGNGIVLIVIFTNWKSFQSLTHLLILHQSVIDFTSSLVFTILRMDRWQPLLAIPGSVGEIFCRLWYSEYPLWALFMTSTLNLVLLSTERYFAVVHPVFHLNKLSREKTKISMALIWFIGFSYQSYLAATNTNVDGACVWGWKDGTESLQTFVGVLTFFLEYFCPLCVISIEYVFIAIKLRGLDKNRGNRQENLNLKEYPSQNPSAVTDNLSVATSANTSRSETFQREARQQRNTKTVNKKENQFSRAFRNVIKTLLLVFLVNVICWTPTEFEYIIYNLGGNINFDSTFHKFSVVLVLCNMVCNPFIYSMQYKEFQKGFRKTFCSSIGLRGNRVESTVATNVSNVSNNPR